MNRIAVLLVGVVLLTSACGEGSIKFGPDDDSAPDTIVINGDIRDINPQVAGAAIVVFAFTNLRDPGEFRDFDKQRSVAVSAGSDPMEFRIDRVARGDITIVFLQDDVSNPDGRIDVGDPEDPSDDDPYAVLADPNGILDGVRRGQTIRITEVDVDFLRGTADAETIRSVSGSEPD